MDGIKCEKCGEILTIGSFPFCPHPQANLEVIGDDIPGGIIIRHGACWPDGTPRKFYSKSAIKQAAYEAGWTRHGDTPKPNQRLEEKQARERESRK